jgi:alcohol dehydrogenase class IV
MIEVCAEEPGKSGFPLFATGRGSLAELPGLLDRLGARRPLLVVGPGLAATGTRVRRLLGVRSVGSFTDAVAHVPSWQANLAVASAQEVHADSVIAVGGGSAAGYAKIVALALRLPRIAIPTTLSGAELTSRYFVTTGKGKESGQSEQAAARAVVRDPDLLQGVPARVLASSGMSAVATCLEILGRPAPAGQGSAAAGLRLLWTVLPRLVRDPADPGLRASALAGAALTGTALAAAGPGPAQLIAEDLGATYRGDHGALMSCLAPFVGGGVELVHELAGPATVGGSIREFAISLGLPVDLGTVCPTVDPYNLAVRLSERADLAGRADIETLLILLKEALALPA